MSIKFSDIGKETKKLPVDLEGDVISITYIRNYAGGAPEEAARKSESQYSYQVVLLALVITAWDILDDKNEPMPITEEVIHGLGTRIQNRIMEEIMADTLPKTMRLSS